MVNEKINGKTKIEQKNTTLRLKYDKFRKIDQNITRVKINGLKKILLLTLAYVSRL